MTGRELEDRKRTFLLITSVYLRIRAVGAELPQAFSIIAAPWSEY